MTDPQPIFYPSCVVNIRLRFDERMVLNAEGAAAYSYSVNELLNRSESSDAPTGIPLFLTEGAPDKISFINARVPLRASIELPAYRDCGKFSLTFAYRDLPIDPRLLRSAGVEIYLDAVAAENFGTGITEAAPPQGERASVITRRGRSSQLTQSINNLAMVGTVDSWKVEHAAGTSLISMEGRDLRAILMQSPVDPKMLPKIPLKSDIGKVVKYIVEKHPFGGKMTIYVPPAEEWPGGQIPSPSAQDVRLSLANVATSAQTRVRQGAEGGGANVSAGGQPDKLNAWDIITRLCQLVGAVPYFKGETLVIAPARSLYAQLGAGPRIKKPGQKGAPAATPFQFGLPRNAGTETLNVRRMVFGRNVDSLNFERKFNGFVARTVEVVSLDTSSNNRGEQKLLKVSWPDKPTNKAAIGAPSTVTTIPTPVVTLTNDAEEAAVSQVAPSGEVGNKDVVRISVPGIKDKKKLLQIAQDIYEELGRGEQGGSVKTKDLASFGAGNEDPDLLRLRPGDAMELLVDAMALSSNAPIRSPLNDNQRASPAELTKELYQRLGDEGLARAIVATSRNLVANLQNFFRVSNVRFDWDVKTGVAVAFDFHNYIEARNAVTPLPQPGGRRGVARSTGQNVPVRSSR